MARVNDDILGISKLKWSGMGEFNSDDHRILVSSKNKLLIHTTTWMILQGIKLNEFKKISPTKVTYYKISLVYNF